MKLAKLEEPLSLTVVDVNSVNIFKTKGASLSLVYIVMHTIVSITISVPVEKSTD